MDNGGIIVSGNSITVNGYLDKERAGELVASMHRGTIYTVDFDGVSDLNFGAQRALLNAYRDGLDFCIINACDTVAEKMEDTGVSVFVNICRKPKQLDITGCDEFGGGYLSRSFNRPDGDSMIKYYSPRVPKWLVAREKAIARAVMVFGIPTPLVGTLYKDGDNMALDFERIEGKRSLSRVIADEPDRLEEISVKFARMCKKLHTTPCDTKVFADRSIFYRQAIIGTDVITEEEKSKALSFLDSVPTETTCLHGDMQLSNAITTGKEDYWIDLSDFGYGNHMFDMGMWYFLSRISSNEGIMHLFHITKDTMDKVWDIFVREYFNVSTREEMDAVEESIQPFAALHMLYLGISYGFEPWMLGRIRQTLFK